MRKLVLRVGENGEEFGIMMIEDNKMWFVNDVDGMTICLTKDVEKAMDAFLSIIQLDRLTKMFTQSFSGKFPKGINPWGTRVLAIDPRFLWCYMEGKNENFSYLRDSHGQKERPYSFWSLGTFTFPFDF